MINASMRQDRKALLLFFLLTVALCTVAYW